MFDAIAYKNAIGPGPLIDIGALAEGLLFYGRVAIVGNSGTVKDLLARIPPFILLSMLRDGRLEFHYLADQIGVSTQAVNGRPRHGLMAFSSPDHTIEKIGPSVFKGAAGNTSQAKIGASPDISPPRLTCRIGILELPVSGARVMIAQILSNLMC